MNTYRYFWSVSGTLDRFSSFIDDWQLTMVEIYKTNCFLDCNARFEKKKSCGVFVQ